MKKLLITLAITVLAMGFAIAQPKAIGGRIGYNLEVSYQHETATGMLEIDAGLTPFIFSRNLFDADGNPVQYRYGRAQIVVFYDWLMNITTDLYWYIGGGAGVSWGYGDFYDIPHYNKQGNLVKFNRMGLPIGLQVGMEYDFSIPLNLSLDWRPMFNVFALRQGDLVSNLLNVAVGVRYRF